MAKSSNVVSQVRTKRAPKPKGSWVRARWEDIKSLAGAVLIYLVIRTLAHRGLPHPRGA